MSTTDTQRSPTPSGEPPEDHGRGISRRQFLPRAAAGAVGLVAAGLVGYEIHPSGGSAQTRTVTAPQPATTTSQAATATTSSEELQSFITRSDLSPPAVRINRLSTVDSSPEYILLSVNNVVPGGPVQQGLMMIDRAGRLVWFLPVSGGETEKPFDLNVQSDRGTPVLTWWQGHLVSSHGAGVGIALDDRYRVKQDVKAGNGLQIDLHELNLTSRGTALITAYELVQANLRSIGGPAKGPVYAAHAQEIDLTSGKVLLDWFSLDHIAIGETYEPVPKAGQSLDYIHMNSVAETTDGNLLISGRNTSALYKVDRSTGKLLWRLGGKRSDFQVQSAARFHYQHHARQWDDTTLTVFDNGANVEKRSRGLLLDVDETRQTVGLTRAYLHPAAFLSATLGSVTRLPDGRIFVGWGGQPYFSEFAPDGSLLLDGQLPIGVRSYRAFTSDWVGRPTEPPVIVAKANPVGGFVVHVSWNGATEVDRWQVLAGPSASRLDAVGAAPWAGFETAIAVNSDGPSFQAVALDDRGRELGRSLIA